MDADRVKDRDGKFGTVRSVLLDVGGPAGYDQIRVESGKTIKFAAALKRNILLMDLHMHDEYENPPWISTHRVIYVVKVKIGVQLLWSRILLGTALRHPCMGTCPESTAAVRSQN